jgi:hypothetical protein
VGGGGGGGGGGGPTPPVWGGAPPPPPPHIHTHTRTSFDLFTYVRTSLYINPRFTSVTTDGVCNADVCIPPPPLSACHC